MLFGDVQLRDDLVWSVLIKYECLLVILYQL